VAAGGAHRGSSVGSVAARLSSIGSGGAAFVRRHSWDSRGRSGEEKGGEDQIETPPVSFVTVATLPFALGVGMLKIAA
jgi:hypothetical protein